MPNDTPGIITNPVAAYPLADFGKRGETSAPVEPTEAEQEAVDKCVLWFTRDKDAKESYMEEMREMYKLAVSDHWDLVGPTGGVLRTASQKQKRPNAVENLTFSLVEGLASEFAQDFDLVDFPVENTDEDAANVMTDVKKALAYKNRVIDERLKWNRWFFWYGTGIWHPYWDPNWIGGAGPNRWIGDCRWKALHPSILFPDARCREDINEGYRCHKAYWAPLEYIQENYPERGESVREDSVDPADLLDADETNWDADEEGDSYSESEHRQGKALLVETWYKGRPLILGKGEKDEGPGLHVIWWAGERSKVYLRHQNYVYFDPGATDAKFPFIVKQCYSRENSIWGFGEAYYLKNPQIMLNKLSETIMEADIHQSVGTTFYEPGTFDEDQANAVKQMGSIPGMWFECNNAKGITRIFGQGISPSVLADVERRKKNMEAVVGRFDITQGRTPGNVTAFQAISLINQRAQVRLNAKQQAMKSALEEVGTYLNRLISRFYNERRVYRLLGKDESQKAKYGVFEPKAVRRVWLKGEGAVLPENQADTTGMAEGADFEVYSPEFDTECRMSTALPTDRVFYMEMAKELYAAKMIDDQTFWYVIERGKFPPWEEIAQKIEAQRAQAMQAQGAQAAAASMPRAVTGAPGSPQTGAAPQMAQGPEMAGGIPQGAEEGQTGTILDRLPPEQRDLFLSLPEEQQMALLSAMLQGQGA